MRIEKRIDVNSKIRKEIKTIIWFYMTKLESYPEKLLHYIRERRKINIVYREDKNRKLKRQSGRKLHNSKEIYSKPLQK